MVLTTYRMYNSQNPTRQYGLWIMQKEKPDQTAIRLLCFQYNTTYKLCYVSIFPQPFSYFRGKIYCTLLKSLYKYKYKQCIVYTHCMGWRWSNKEIRSDGCTASIIKQIVPTLLSHKRVQLPTVLLAPNIAFLSFVHHCFNF